MSSKKFISTILLATSFISINSYAKDFYAGVKGILSTKNDVNYSTNIPSSGDSEANYGGGAGIFAGYYIPNSDFRTELSVSYTRQSEDENNSTVGSFEGTGAIEAYTPMLTAYYDIPVDFVVKPYVDAGVGYSFLKNTAFGYSDDSDGVFVWQVGTGISYPICEKSELFTGYNYSRGETAEFATPTPSKVEFDIETHNIELGYRYKF